MRERERKEVLSEGEVLRGRRREKGSFEGERERKKWIRVRENKKTSFKRERERKKRF